MFSISLFVCALLMLDVTAKPRSQLTEDGSQQIIVSLDDKGRMLRGEEVEPPEDMDDLQYNIDPRMKIWQSLIERSKQPPVAEGDLDEPYHPSPADAQDQNGGFHPVADTKEEAFGEGRHEEPEQDMDKLYHKAREQLEVYLAPLMADYRSGVETSDVLSEPQDSPYQPAQRYEAQGLSMVRLHLQPEEDSDDLHHQDPRVFQQDSAFQQAAAPVQYPSQRRHTEPEEDRDALYHP